MADWILGRVTRRTAWNATHFSLQIACDRGTFNAGQFVRIALDIDGERIARPYSCVNSPDQPGVEILLNTVPEGPLSNRLAGLQEGDSVWVSSAANGFLTLEEVPVQAHDLWLLATGTGVGPFLSILQTAEPWQRFERVTLAYGVRDLSSLAYPGLLDRLLEQHGERLRVIPCVTGQAPEPGFHGRISEAFSSGQLEQLAGREIDAQHSHVMLCGNGAMITQMLDLLGQRGLRKHLRREPGQISIEKYH